MAGARVIETERLVLRGWTPADREPFAAMNADPVVMEHFPATLSRTESDAFADAFEAEFERSGYGLWVVEIPGETSFAGFVGLHLAEFESDFTPAVEVGWRLRPDAWGRGIATEGARAALRFGFDEIHLDEIVSFTSEGHIRSRAVMERIGLRHEGSFEHPGLPVGHPLRTHVLYRTSASEWRAQEAASG